MADPDPCRADFDTHTGTKHHTPRKNVLTGKWQALQNKHEAKLQNCHRAQRDRSQKFVLKGPVVSESARHPSQDSPRPAGLLPLDSLPLRAGSGPRA